MTLPNTDLFIINRNRTNYQVDYNNLKQYIPGMPAGARCLFYMDSAPYGWSIDNDAKFTEATVRVVSGSGGSNGGNKDFSYVFKSWNTSVPTHNHGISAGTHKHTGAVSHNHSIRDRGHTHSTSRMPASIADRADIVDLAEPLYTDGASDGEGSYRSYKIAIGDSSITLGTELEYPDRQTALDDFINEANELIKDNELIENEVYSYLLKETLERNSTEGFVAVLQALSDFSDGIITQAELNTIADSEVERIESYYTGIRIENEIINYSFRSACTSNLMSYSKAGYTNSCHFDNGVGHSFTVVGGGGTNPWQTLPVVIDASTKYNYRISSSGHGGSNPINKVRHFCCTNCDQTIPGEQFPGDEGNMIRMEDIADSNQTYDDLVIKTSKGKFIRTSPQTGILDPTQGTPSCGGSPEPAVTGISINNNNPNVSFANAKASGLKTTNTTGNVGNSLDFTVKYHKGIVCQKDPY